MNRSRRWKCPTAFTLVEMLVVIGIIAILAALLLPAVNYAIVSARNAAIAAEINQINSAVESYRLEKGDYPPNFRDFNAVLRHVMKCYPRINPTYAQAFAQYACNINGAQFIDEGESLVFWLSMTDTNAQYPFLSFLNPNPITQANPSGLAPNPKRYYDFDQTRLQSNNAVAESGAVANVGMFNSVPAFLAKYCGETSYIYIDSRSYDELTVIFRPNPPAGANLLPPAYAEDPAVGVRPYWSSTVNTSQPTAVLTTLRFRAANATTFQIIAAGQDGDFGLLTTDTDVKVFPTGPYNQGDRDNITNFSSGKRLNDLVP